MVKLSKLAQLLEFVLNNPNCTRKQAVEVVGKAAYSYLDAYYGYTPTNRHHDFITDRRPVYFNHERSHRPATFTVNEAGMAKLALEKFHAEKNRW